MAGSAALVSAGLPKPKPPKDEVDAAGVDAAGTVEGAVAAGAPKVKLALVAGAGDAAGVVEPLAPPKLNPDVFGGSVTAGVLGAGVPKLKEVLAGSAAFAVPAPSAVGVEAAGAPNEKVDLGVSGV